MLGNLMGGGRQHGVSLIGLMVGLAIGLIVVVAASAVLAAHVREHRAMLIEARLMQDLRTAMEVITRDLRRAGYWGHASSMIGSAAAANPYVAVAPTRAASDAVSFQLSRDATENNVLDDNEQFGFRLRKGVVEMLIGGGSWQALTDAGTMAVVSFKVTPSTHVVSLRDSCVKPCDADAITCGPTQQVRNLAVSISAHSATDAKVARSLASDVRVRNDAIVGACPA